MKRRPPDTILKLAHTPIEPEHKRERKNLQSPLSFSMTSVNHGLCDEKLVPIGEVQGQVALKELLYPAGAWPESTKS